MYSTQCYSKEILGPQVRFQSNAAYKEALKKEKNRKRRELKKKKKRELDNWE